MWITFCEIRRSMCSIDHMGGWGVFSLKKKGATITHTHFTKRIQFYVSIIFRTKLVFRLLIQCSLIAHHEVIAIIPGVSIT